MSASSCKSRRISWLHRLLGMQPGYLPGWLVSSAQYGADVGIVLSILCGCTLAGVAMAAGLVIIESQDLAIWISSAALGLIVLGVSIAAILATHLPFERERTIENNARAEQNRATK